MIRAVGRLSQCYLSIKEKSNFNNQFICNEHTEVIFTFDNLFFVGYMNACV